MPLCSSFCPYRGPEPAGRVILSDWLGRARSQIAQIGPGSPKLVDRRARARVGPEIAASRARPRLLRLYGYLPRGTGRGVDADDGTSGSQVQGDGANATSLSGLGGRAPDEGDEPPVMAQACGIGPAETCSPKTAATMPPMVAPAAPPHRPPPSARAIHIAPSPCLWASRVEHVKVTHYRSPGLTIRGSWPVDVRSSTVDHAAIRVDTSIWGGGKSRNDPPNSIGPGYREFRLG